MVDSIEKNNPLYVDVDDINTNFEDIEKFVNRLNEETLRMHQSVRKMRKKIS